MKNKTVEKKYKAVIIGAGRIAAGFDVPGSKKTLTYANAFKKHPLVELLGFFDKDNKVGVLAAKKWHCANFESLEGAMATKPDIVAICVPDEYHYSVLLSLIKFIPKIVICEKPLTKNLTESNKIVKRYEEASIPLLVNYSRRFDLAVQWVRSEIIEEKYGKVISASGIYTKGLLHNGSHLIDLARFLLGEVKKVKSFYRIYDYEKKDPSVAGFLEFEKCSQFHLMIGDSRIYKIFEMNILFEKGSLTFIESGFFFIKKEVVNDKIYSGYKILGQPKTAKTKLENALSVTVENVIQYLNHSVPLICSGSDALKTQKACISLINETNNQ